MDKQEIKKIEKKIVELTQGFCSQKLDNDYRQLCEKLIKKMGRKRNVPFTTGKIEILAASVVYAIGSINFLFDKSFEPYITAQEISDYFKTKNSTVSNKAKQIREMLKLDIFDNEFSTKHTKENNPFNNFVTVDGLIVPLSSLPENLQEIIKTERGTGRDIYFSTKK